MQLSNLTLDLESGSYDTVPAQLKKENPQFHLLVHAPEINTGVCRCLLSSYILDYPPPTLVGYQPGALLSQNDTESNTTYQNGIPDVSDYLMSERRIKEEDAVLVVDGETTLFQLPSEVLLSSFAMESRHQNHELAEKYPPVKLHSPYGPQRVQRFNQSVFFASARTATNTLSDQARQILFAHPKQAVASADSEATHMNDATILGTGWSLRRLFHAASTANNQFARTDSETFRTMYAQQARVRASVFDSPRHRRSVWSIWKLWLTCKFSVDRAVRKEWEKESRASAMRDLGMGVDKEGAMIYTIPDGALSASDDLSERKPLTEDRHRVGYVESANASGLGIPDVLREEGIRGPFGLHPYHFHQNLTEKEAAREAEKAAASSPETRDAEAMTEEAPLPDDETDWSSIPLLVDPNTGSVPPVISLPDYSSPAFSDADEDDVWEKLWFQPYARTLLNQYLARSKSKEVASEAAVGGERWWDRRGGRGGVWTTEGEWIDTADLCASFGEDLFVDKKEIWGQRMVAQTPSGETVMVGAAGTPQGGQSSANAETAVQPPAQAAPEPASEKEQGSGQAEENAQQESAGEKEQSNVQTNENIQQSANVEVDQAEEWKFPSPSKSQPDGHSEQNAQQSGDIKVDQIEEWKFPSASQSQPASTAEATTPHFDDVEVDENEEWRTPPSSSKEQSQTETSTSSESSPQQEHEEETRNMPIAIMPDGIKKALSELSSNKNDDHAVE